MRGYAVCDDFYSPNYRRRPLPDTKDYRRTLLWMPEVKFNAEGKAIVQLYNNSKPTAISIEAEGITRNGKPVVWNGKNAVQDHAYDTSDTAETDHGAEETGTDILYHNVRNAGTALPQEKVYLHLDNTCYFLGDTIWYKGYVTRTDRGTLTDMSKILYVDLFTPDGYLVERQQLEMTDGTAHGMFVLQDTLYGGYYELRAYTRWMLNFGQCEYPHIKETENRFYSLKMAKEFFRDYEKLYSRVFPCLQQGGKRRALFQEHDPAPPAPHLQEARQEAQDRPALLPRRRQPGGRNGRTGGAGTQHRRRGNTCPEWTSPS